MRGRKGGYESRSGPVGPLPASVTNRVPRVWLGPNGDLVWQTEEKLVDPFESIVEEILELNRRKRGDYATNNDPWSNFKDSSRQIGTPPGTSVEVLIATKQSRLRQLLTSGREPNNESVRDTLLDRAVYSIIALAMYDEGLYSE